MLGGVADETKADDEPEEEFVIEAEDTLDWLDGDTGFEDEPEEVGGAEGKDRA